MATMWIERSIEPRLVELARHFPAVLLTGARQSGKSALLRHAFPDAREIALDLPSMAEIAETDPTSLWRDGDTRVLLDEVQYAPRMFRHLKAAIDRRRHDMGRFLLTGSQKFQLMASVSESLAGRCAVVELPTLSAMEIGGALEGEAPDVLGLIHRGGYPELYRDPDVATESFYASYVATYLERDVRAVLRVGSLRDFERFVRACAARTAQLLNLTDLARDVGVSPTTAREWLSVLEATQVVTLLEPWFGNVGKRLVKTPKLYVSDTGLACFLLGVDTPDAIAGSHMVGALWETFVLQQIHAARAATGTSAKVYVYRDAYGAEVDFLIERDGRVHLVEAKWAESVGERDLSTLNRLLNEFGARAATSHWVACRTEHPRPWGGDPRVRFVHGASFAEWFGSRSPVASRGRPKRRAPRGGRR